MSFKFNVTNSELYLEKEIQRHASEASLCQFVFVSQNIFETEDFFFVLNQYFLNPRQKKNEELHVDSSDHSSINRRQLFVALILRSLANAPKSLTISKTEESKAGK